jgi:hypothetical protein
MAAAGVVEAVDVLKDGGFCLTPRRRETSATGYPRSVIWITASRLNSSLKLGFPIFASCPQS